MALADDIGFKIEVFDPAAGQHVAHVAVEHGDGGGRVRDQDLQVLQRVAEPRF